MKRIKVLLVLLLSLLVLPGCVANQNGRDTYFKFIDDGYSISYFDSDVGEPNKYDTVFTFSKQDGFLFGGLYLKDGSKYSIRCNIPGGKEATEYCIYGGNDKCFGEYAKSAVEDFKNERKNNEKIYKKMLKKYDITNEDILDMMDYIYSEHKGETIDNE